MNLSDELFGVSGNSTKSDDSTKSGNSTKSDDSARSVVTAAEGVVEVDHVADLLIVV